MKHALRTALAVLTLILLTACGGSDHNDADVTFATEMIPHHRQALMMARLADGNGASAEVRDLAARIERAQGPEIDQMSGWLEEWDEAGDHGGHGSGGMEHGESGMMGPGDMRALMAARGAEFDRLFLTQMIEHHRGAIEMARTEQDDGESADAISLAEEIKQIEKIKENIEYKPSKIIKKNINIKNS